MKILMTISLPEMNSETARMNLETFQARTREFVDQAKDNNIPLEDLSETCFLIPLESGIHALVQLSDLAVRHHYSYKCFLIDGEISKLSLEKVPEKPLTR